MKVFMYERKGVAGIGVWTESGLRGLERSMPGYPGDLEGLLAAEADLRSVESTLRAAPPLVSESIRFLPPIQHPSKILCVGLNYLDHSAETGVKAPDYPTIFARFPSCLVGHDQPIVKPSCSDQLDYEGELVAVIGKRGRKIPKSSALDYIAAYSIFNDASIRDYQTRTSQWTMGKNFDGTGGFGPWLVTADEVPLAAGLRVSTRLNGAIVQDARTSDMVFGVAELVTHLSQVMTLEPGDVLVTGTPGGVGMARKPPLYMKPGDLCEVEIEGIGILRNPIIQG